MFHSEDRLKNNLKILDILKMEAFNHPQLRFWQLLTCLQIIRYENNVDKVVVKDAFYEESLETLNRLKNVINNIEN